MINFRFHLLSLIAVFLALAIGIALGATVIDRATVDLLNRRIDAVSQEADSTRAANDALRAELRRTTDFIDAVATAAVQAKLTDRPVLVFAERGIDAAPVKAVVALLQAAGADAPAIVWLEPKWRLSDRSARDDLLAATGETGDGTPAGERRSAFAALAARVTSAPLAGRATATSSTSTLSTTSNTTSRAAPDVLEALRTRDFVGIERAGPKGRDDLRAFGGRGGTAVLVVGTAARDPAPDLVTSFAGAFRDAGVAVAVAEEAAPDSGAADRGQLVGAVRRSGALAGAVSTVDDLELTQGRIALVLALSVLGAGRVGHYGYGRDATAPLPDL